MQHDNILFRPASLEAVVSHELVEDPSVSYQCGTEIRPTVIPAMSQVLPLTTEPPVREEDLEAVIADVGHSHWRRRHFQELIQPTGLRAPEVILGYPWDTPADIWNVGCIVGRGTLQHATRSYLCHRCPDSSSVSGCLNLKLKTNGALRKTILHE